MHGEAMTQRFCWLACVLALVAGCLPARLENKAAEPPGAVDDAGVTGDALAGDATATDAKPGADVVKTDGSAKDAALKGCSQASDCAQFHSPCAVAQCGANGVCAMVGLADGATCTDADACAESVCQAGSCVRKAVDCSDGNPCTADSCAPAPGCTHSNVSAFCSDGDACTENDKCQEGSCAPGTARKCDDLNACTTDSCDPGQGCVHAASDGAVCDDGQACTDTDACKAGKCAGKPVICKDEDANPCTLEGCDKTNGQCSSATYQGEGKLPCDDGNSCTKEDLCTGVTCAGTADDCDDKNACTTDQKCDPTSGCVHVDNTDACSKDACSGVGKCQAGSCVAEVKSCDDGNLCSSDGCDLAKGCTHTAADGACNDGDACSEADTCAAGSCKAGVKTTCDDGDPCTTDSCDAKTGCKHAQADPTQSVTCAPDKQCVAGQCVGNSCGDGLCGFTEDTVSCAKDCPASGGACSASDADYATCMTSCRASKCADADAACSGDGDCTGLSECLAPCATPQCDQACFAGVTPTTIAVFLSDNACVQAFCVADGWIGKKCSPAISGYGECIDGCTSAMCPVQDSACKADSTCAAVIKCSDACGQGDTACVKQCGADNALFDARQKCIGLYCL